jgi:hypothetical protein
MYANAKLMCVSEPNGTSSIVRPEQVGLVSDHPSQYLAHGLERLVSEWSMTYPMTRSRTSPALPPVEPGWGQLLWQPKSSAQKLCVVPQYPDFPQHTLSGHSFPGSSAPIPQSAFASQFERQVPAAQWSGSRPHHPVLPLQQDLSAHSLFASHRASPSCRFRRLGEVSGALSKDREACLWW